MKRLYFFSIILSYLIYIIKCNPEEAHHDRNFKTIKFVLSKFQHYSIKDISKEYSFFTIHLSNITFFPADTSQMKLESKFIPINRLHASKILLTFYCNLTIILKETPKRLHENNFFIEINITDTIINAGEKLNEPMSFRDINNFILQYSAKRNFLTMKRFDEFKELSKLNNFMRQIVQEYRFVFDEYNYYNIDFDEINKSLKMLMQVTLDTKIDDTTVLENYFYSSYKIPNCKMRDDMLNVNGYSIIIAYDLRVDGVVKKLSLEIILSYFTFSYEENSYGLHAFGLDCNNERVNHILLNIFKNDFENKSDQYYNTFKVKKNIIN